MIIIMIDIYDDIVDYYNYDIADDIRDVDVFDDIHIVY